ncbi:MAG: late competence development ComFB family protein [Dethiobacter sp.]|nr:late competence development ComFB family protein [Dethiobacter sp.]
MAYKLSFQEVLSIAAFIPSYREGVGQGITLFYRDGTTGWQSRGLRSFVEQLARFFAINIQDARRKYGSLLGQVNLTPLAFSPFLIFLPLKASTPRVGCDPAYGYFRLRSITGVGKEPAPSTLDIEGGHKITIRQSLRIVRSRIRAAKRLEEMLLDEYSKTMDQNQEFFLLATGWAAGFLQRNNPQQSESTPNTAGSEPPGLHNLMEELVVRRLDETFTLDKNKICSCRQCRLEIITSALNLLPPCYLFSGSLGSEPKQIDNRRYDEEVKAAVSHALRKIKKNPPHD